jgi:protein SCO1/2
MILLLCLSCGRAAAQLTGEVEELEGVGIEEKLGDYLPLDLTFRDSRDRSLPLGDLFDGRRPVILSLNYSDCPMLCQLQLNGLTEGLRQLDWDVGEDFVVVSISIDPLETPLRARQTKQRYVRTYGRPKTAGGWYFLTGSAESIDRLAAATGFGFRYVPERREYAHAAAIMVCTASGQLSRYLYGIVYPPQTVKMALVEAGEGKIGSTLDQVLLFCLHYDATSGKYAPLARRIMQLAAAATLGALALGLLPIWLRHVSRKNAAATTPVQP